MQAVQEAKQVGCLGRGRSVLEDAPKCKACEDTFNVFINKWDSHCQGG